MYNAFAEREEKLQDCAPPYSFFKLIRSVWKGYKKSAPPPDPLHRLCTLMRKMKAKSFVKEKLLLNPELEDEIRMADARCGGGVKMSSIVRLTFFRSFPESRHWDELNDNDLLGYAIIVTLKLPGQNYRTYMLESVVRPPSLWLDLEKKKALPVTNYYTHCARTFKTCIGTKRHSKTYNLIGSFFTQQNNLTSVCAHAALRTVLNSSAIFIQDIENQKLTNRAINETLFGNLRFQKNSEKIGEYKGDPIGTKKGLDNKDIEDVVKSLVEGRVILGNFSLPQGNGAVEYDDFVYPLIESGMPAILGVEGWNFYGVKQVSHVISILGHTLNTDRWDPEARLNYGRMFPYHRASLRYIPVTEWIDHYIINDDNLGMYLTCPSDMLRSLLMPSKNPELHAVIAMGIVFEDILLPGHVANMLASGAARMLINDASINAPNFWLNHLKRGNLVCRTFLQRKQSYLEHIKEFAKESGVLTSQIERKFMNLPSSFWLTELSLPNVYTGNKHKLGEIIVHSDRAMEKFETEDLLILGWVPGSIYFRMDDSTEKWINEHVPIIRGQEPTLSTEW